MDEPELKIIDVFMCKLRKNLANASNGKNFIETVWGRGYMQRQPDDLGAGDKRPELGPHHLGGRAPDVRGLGEAAVRAGDDVLGPDDLREANDTFGDEFRMLEEDSGVRNHARNENLSGRQFDVFPDAPFMFVARITELK